MKKAITILTIIVLLLLTTACSIHAQYATRGVVDLGGAISFSSSTAVANGESADNSTSLFQFTPSVNYFIMDGFSLGLTPGITVLKIAGASESIKNYSIFFTPAYTFTTKSSVFPYVQGMIGYTALQTDASPVGGGGKLDLTGLSFGGKGGVKIAVGNSGLVNIGVSYIMYTLNAEGADKRSGFNSLAVGVGYSVYFR